MLSCWVHSTFRAMPSSCSVTVHLQSAWSGVTNLPLIGRLVGWLLGSFPGLPRACASSALALLPCLFLPSFLACAKSIRTARRRRESRVRLWVLMPSAWWEPVWQKAGESALGWRRTLPSTWHRSACFRVKSKNLLFPGISRQAATLFKFLLEPWMPETSYSSLTLPYPLNPISLHSLITSLSCFRSIQHSIHFHGSPTTSHALDYMLNLSRWIRKSHILKTWRQLFGGIWTALTWCLSQPCPPTWSWASHSPPLGLSSFIWKSRCWVRWLLTLFQLQWAELLSHNSTWTQMITQRERT